MFTESKEGSFRVCFGNPKICALMFNANNGAFLRPEMFTSLDIAPLGRPRHCSEQQASSRCCQIEIAKIMVFTLVMQPQKIDAHVKNL